MKSLLSFAVFAVISSVIYGNQKLPKNTFLLDKPDDVLFQEFQNKFGANFAKATEKNERFKIFSQNLVKIRALNALNNGAKYGINEFSDISPEEFKQRLLSDEFVSPQNVQTINEEDANTHGDWWQNEYRRSRSCGSCWAFANVAAVEAHYAIKNNGAMIGLSEQELVDCETISHGCNGGYPDVAFDYIRQKGLHSRTNYPYTGYTNGHGCQANMTGTKIKIADYFYILPNNETEVRNFLFNKGPAVMIFVFPYSLQYYVSGIFSLTWDECLSQRNGRHAMTIIGYGEENGKKYWIAKNSWGSWWGENGFIRFERDIGFCGIVSNYYLLAPSFDAPTTTTSTTTTTTTPIPSTTTTTTVRPKPLSSLNCSGAIDLVFVIDVSWTMTEERLNIVKSQLLNAITLTGIKWESINNDTARIGIILTTDPYSEERAIPLRYLDFAGHQNYPYQSPKLVTRTIHLKQAFRDIIFAGGVNDIGLSMNYSINGDSAFTDGYFPFGDPIFLSEGDRPNVPNAMIVITGTDKSNPTIPSTLLKNFNVDIYSIGFEDVSMAHLQAISGNPAKAFSTTPINLANTINNICAGYLNDVPTTTPSPTTIITTPIPITTTTTAVQPQPLVPLNCSGAMDLVFVIDGSSFERLEIIKSQLIIAIDQNGIKWQQYNNKTARIGIVLSTDWATDGFTDEFKYYDIKGCPYQQQYSCSPTTTLLKTHINDMHFYGGGKNDIALGMTLSLKGNYQENPITGYLFGEPLFGGSGDRPNIPNAMIVISGADSSNVSTISNELKLSGVQVFSIGFQDLPISQLQAISGEPSRAFSTSPENVANIIKKICTGI
uniref:VWFA domain-containing protein n=1 Tax=Panagrolaimus sp. PS1159 TaxID=55785 RepID=A0AC35GN82_9BILA